MSTEQNHSEVVPPYVSFATFSNALASLIEHGLPAQIDRSVLGKFSGSAQRHIIQSFKSLGLIDENNCPTDKLKKLIQKDKELQKEALANILRSRFPGQVKILPNGTSQQLRSSFDNIKVEPSVKSKCITFFLKAAQEAGLEISSHILKAPRRTTPRRDAPRKRRKTVKARKRDDKPEDALEIQQFEGLVSLPISLGPNKVWYVHVDEQCTKDDVDRFTQIIGIVLGDNK